MSNFDFYVSAIKYNSDETHIAKLRVHQVKSDGSWNTSGQEMTRPEVIELIRNKRTLCTVFRGSDGKWRLGAKIEIIPVTTDYLKTRKDSSTKDNLESLPLM